MTIPPLVNGYVLPNLFYELIFLSEHGIEIESIDWADDVRVRGIIIEFVRPRFETFSATTKTVVADTLRFLLSPQNSNQEVWETIWEACSAPVPTPKGVPYFMKLCFDALTAEIALLPFRPGPYRVRHDAQAALRLN